MDKEIDVVSLFSGIGGFEEGLRLANIKNRIVFASEIDLFAQISYKSNFSGAFLHGDITKIDENEIPSHQLLVAGFPCQAFSIAGKQQGFEDTRGTLFFDVARILNKKRPKYIVLENVKNLISHNNSKTIIKILETLNEIGYVVDFTVINSYEAGVPQNRDRTYICGILNGVSEKFVYDKRSVKANKLKEELNKTDFSGFNFFNKVNFNDEQKYIEDIIEDNVDSKFFLNSDSVREFLKSNSEVKDVKNERKIIKLFDLPREVHNDLERQRRIYSIKGISPTVLARSDSTKILINENGNLKIRKITPTENFFIQGFDKHFVENIKNTGMSATQMYKQSGNAVSPPVIAGILRQLNEEYIIND
jgi:modification methylase SPRI